jgi:hypothetical protein
LPDVHDRNKRALELWRMVNGQWRFSFGGPVALDLSAVESCLRITGTCKENRMFLTNQLLTIGEVILAERQLDSNNNKLH